MSDNKSTLQYKVLSPWSEIDPVPLQGISPHLADLNNKTLGFFDNGKPVAIAMLNAAKHKLQEKYPGLTFDWYIHEQRFSYNILQIESQNKANFLKWLHQVDAVVTAVGD
jgi:hypothetical protein